ncbi:HXXEE domain-containing protein [Anaerocolumna sp. MB42-C2]|uniref:HXXEE domain-containing protein n=1 Tax=Anaerocolumna sp. MB42-C2 TaxID=3070997 RepID=UPI003FA43CF9
MIGWISIAVGVEFLGFSLISLFSGIFQGYFLWYGAYIGLILHYVLIHIFLSIRFKGYVPGILTSVIFLFPGIWILYKAEQILHFWKNTICMPFRYYTNVYLLSGTSQTYGLLV